MTVNTRLALLCGANPRFATDGPRVRLASGKWKIVKSGCKDSRLFLIVTTKPFVSPFEDMVTPHPVHDELVIDLEVHGSVQLIWEHRGQEKFISVHAEKVA